MWGGCDVCVNMLSVYVWVCVHVGVGVACVYMLCSV